MKTEQLTANTQVIIQQISEIISSSNSFVIEQMPSVVQEMITYAIISDVALLVITICVLILSYFCTFKWTDQTPVKPSDLDVPSYKILCGVVGSVISGVFIIISIAIIFDLSKLYIAPKVWIIEHLRNLV